MKLTHFVASCSVALSCSQAHSTQYVEQPKQQSSTASASSSSSSVAVASANSSAVGLGVGIGMGGTATGGNAVSAGGNGGTGGTGGTGGVGNGGSASLTYVEASAAKQRGTVTIKNTPDGALSNIAPTAPCMGGTSVGGSGPGFSIGIGTTWKDSDCSLRETARSFAGLGLTDDAIAILCSSEYAAAAPSCKNLKIEESR